MGGHGGEGQQSDGPDHRGGGVGNHEGPEFQFGHARNQRDGRTERPHEAADKDRPGAPAMKEMQALFNLVLEAPKQPEMHDFVVIVEPDPPRDPVSHDRTDDRSGNGGEKPYMRGANHPAQGEQKDRSGNDERNADKGFRTGDGEGDGKYPVRMGLGGEGDPVTRVMGEPMEYAEKHEFACCCYRADSGPVADIALLRQPYQLLGHLRHISPLLGGYISSNPLRV